MSRSETLREVALTLESELAHCPLGAVVVDGLPDGNHRITFPYRGTDEGGIGPSRGDRPPGPEVHRLRYTVDLVSLGRQLPVRCLLRQTLDAADQVVEQRMIAVGLRRGRLHPPGFRVVHGDAGWRVVLATRDASRTGLEGR